MIRRVLLSGLMVAALSGVLMPAPLRAQDEEDVSSASEGALFLLLPVGARGIALGRAMTALDGPESVWWNPAGLGTVTEGRALLLRGEDISGQATGVSFLFPRPNLGVVGLSYQLTDVADVELRDNNGNVLGNVSFRDHLGILSVASEVVSAVSLGVNLKLVQQRITCRGQCNDAGVTATTYSVDAGLQWRDVAGLPLRLGAAIVHAGPSIQFINAEQSDPQPTRLRVGAAYDVLRHFVDDPLLHALISVELEERWRDPGSPATYVGAEVGAGGEQSLVVRAGYVFGAELQVDGAGVGVGLRYDSFELGIGKSLASTGLNGETEPVHLTLGYVF